ncbi:16614_t:CDS:2, partial [Gigaspora rosea]
RWIYAYYQIMDEDFKLSVKNGILLLNVVDLARASASFLLSGCRKYLYYLSNKLDFRQTFDPILLPEKKIR